MKKISIAIIFIFLFKVQVQASEIKIQSQTPSCSLCHILSKTKSDLFYLRIKTISLKSYKSGVESYLEMIEQCKLEKNKEKEKAKGRYTVRFSLSSKHVNLFDYEPQHDLGFVTVEELVNKATTEKSDLSCKKLEESKLTAIIEYKYYQESTAEERRKHQDHAHGYNPKPSPIIHNLNKN